MTIQLKDFFKYAGINYSEDLYNQMFNEYQEYEASEIEHNLPKKYSHLTSAQIKNNSELHNILNYALNKTIEKAMINEAYKEQRKTCEEYADSMIEYINGLSDDNKPAIKSIALCWEDDTVKIEYYKKGASLILQEIINGEGIFYYENYTDIEVETHPHYLLNIPLIAKIWGMIGKPHFEWQVNSWNIDPDYFKECIDDELICYGEKIQEKRDHENTLQEWILKNVVPLTN